MPRLSFVFLWTLLFILVNNLAFAQQWQWAKSGSSLGTDVGFAIAVDAVGNSYVTGYFEQVATFGDIELTSAGYRDVFLVKYDPKGKAVWAQRAGGADYDSGYGVAVDNKGNAYVTGRIDGTGFFGEKSDIFIFKYDSGGNLVWTQRMGGTGMDFGTDIAVDATDNIYITGRVEGIVVFGDIKVPTTDIANMFVAKYDAAGRVVWVKKTGNSTEYLYNGLGLDNQGNVYVTGSFDDSFSFDLITLTSKGSNDVFIAKYDPEGHVIWVKSAGGRGWDYGCDITLDASGNCYVVGTFWDSTANFDSFTLPNKGNHDVFIAKYNATGEIQWVKQAGGPNSEVGEDIAVDKAGNIYITGQTDGAFTIGPTTINSDPNGTMFTAMYNTMGEVVWAKQAGNYGAGIVVDDKGNGYVTGYFSFTTSFDNFTITAAGSDTDMFIAKFGAAPVPGNPDDEELIIPNIITPNNDKLNDFFVPKLPEGIAVDLKVYNRWGKLVYEKVNYQNTWNGDNLNAGTYYYLLTGATGEAWKGWIEIIK